MMKLTMTRKAPIAPNESALKDLLTVIVLHDRSAALRLLAQTPSLAREAVSLGATREDPITYWFEPIMHYAYAGDTALHLAAAAYDLQISNKLISKGANVQAKNRRGAEPLHYAADGSPNARHWNPDAQSAVIAALIAAGADPNCEDKSGVAPLHRAVRTRCTAAVQALIVNGADPRMKNKSGSTPLHLAVQDTGRGGSGSAAARAQQGEIIKLLLSHGARPTDKNSSGRTVKDSVTADWIRALLVAK
jgi:hypothetical protein